MRPSAAARCGCHRRRRARTRAAARRLGDRTRCQGRQLEPRPRRQPTAALAGLTARAADARLCSGHRERGMLMAWNLKGSYVETCSCELMCPCNLSFDHGATYDYCRVTLVFDIREGEIDGTDVGGLRVAAVADTPKVMTEGNWRLGVFVDSRASDEQADKLVGVFSGQLGGPMGGLGPLGG